MKPLEVDIMSSHTTAEVGDNVDITCVSKDDYKPKPSFAILVNGQVDKRYQRCLSLSSSMFGLCTENSCTAFLFYPS